MKQKILLLKWSLVNYTQKTEDMSEDNRLLNLKSPFLVLIRKKPKPFNERILITVENPADFIYRG